MTRNRIKEQDTALFLLEEAEAQRIIKDVQQHFSSDEGEFEIDVFSWSTLSQRWARNRAMMASTQRDLSIRIVRNFRGQRSGVTINRADSDSLKAATEYVEHFATRFAPKEVLQEMMLDRPQWDAPGSDVWSDTTFSRTPVENGRMVRQLTQASRESDMLSAGFLETGAAKLFRTSRDEYGRESQTTGEVTQAQCSITVRHPQGSGSGWAGNTSFDINRLDLEKISETAFDKCLKSINPVRIEPGRYQVILEPQAGAVFFQLLMRLMLRPLAEGSPRHPFYLGVDQALQRHRSKLGLPIIDRRLTIDHDPEHPVVGTHPQRGVGPLTVIKDGVLTEMFYDYRYSLNELVKEMPASRRTSFRVQGTSTTVEEMISGTERGLIVTTVSEPELIDASSSLYTGFTRNGLWLIERGQITRAVRNFRWTESPLFVLNNVQEVGTSLPIFSPASMRGSLMHSLASSLNNVAVPALKVNDFSFTSIIDAI